MHSLPNPTTAQFPTGPTPPPSTTETTTATRNVATQHANATANVPTLAQEPNPTQEMQTFLTTLTETITQQSHASQVLK